MPEFFELRQPTILVEQDRTARKEDRRWFEESLDRYLELKERLDAKIALGQNITWDEETDFIAVSTEVLKSVVVIGAWQLDSKWSLPSSTTPDRPPA